METPMRVAKLNLAAVRMQTRTRPEAESDEPILSVQSVSADDTAIAVQDWDEVETAADDVEAAEAVETTEEVESAISVQAEDAEMVSVLDAEPTEDVKDEAVAPEEEKTAEETKADASDTGPLTTHHDEQAKSVVQETEDIDGIKVMKFRRKRKVGGG